MNNRISELEKHFLKIKLNSETIDVFVPRTAILDAVKKSLYIFKGTLLDVGCGQMPYRELILKENNLVEKYIGLDLASSSVHNTDIADLHWDAHTIPLENESVDSAMATEVLEHSFNPTDTLKEICRVLKPNGTFFFTVPFIWPLHETPYDAYRYTPFSLRMHLEKAGFNNIKIESLGGWHASFAQMMGIWVKESNLSGWKNKIALKISKFFIPYLIKNDLRDNNFGQHCMITGLYGTATKNK